jgi:DUF4097 and DUF4098 domain-containing protein YvlB
MRRTLALMTIGATMAAGMAGAQDVDTRVLVRRIDSTRYQGRNTGPEQTERFSRKVRIGRDGRVSLGNISGDIIVTGGSGDEITIDAVKRTRGDRSELASVRIEVDERAGAVEIRTTHTGRNDRVSVDYTVSMPAAGSLEVHSVSGNVKVAGVRGAVRAETVSGNVTASDTPKLTAARSVSGNVALSGVSTDGDLSAGSVSGNITARSVKVRGLELSSVSGDVSLTDVTCDRLGVKSVSGSVEYNGAVNRGGSYDINVHSGTVRLTLPATSGFALNANSFSGSIRSELPLTIGGDRADADTRAGSRRRDRGVNAHAMRAVYGDGSATVTVHTFSGDIVIVKR